MRSSGVASMSRLLPSMPTRTLVLVRLSRGSMLLQTLQSQPIIGIPWLVPVPKNVSSIAIIINIADNNDY